jgi:hypothetical protein
MTSSNIQPIIRSYALASRFANGRVTADRLIPPSYRRIQTLHQKVWREEPLSSGCDWGVSNFTFLIPESVTILSSLFLRVDLPALSVGKVYKKNPALYVIKDFRLVSGGNVVYEQDIDSTFRDCLESMTQEEYVNFSKAHLGYEAVATKDARTIYIPIPIPNSHINQRSGSSDRGLGVLPCETNRVRIECQFSLHAANNQCTDSSVTTGTIASKCTMCMREVKMSDANAANYRSKVGEYSVVTRRFQELNAWQTVEANTEVTVKLDAPQGNCSEFQVIAVSFDADKTKRNIYDDTIMASSLQMQCDGVTVRDFNTPEKLLLHNYSEGFQNHAECKQITRLCFGSHSSENSTTYTGSMNFRNISQTKLILKFPVKVDFRLVAVQLMSVQIESTGLLKAYLD